MNDQPEPNKSELSTPEARRDEEHLSEIPSVVSSGPQRKKAAITVFLAAMAFLAFMAVRPRHARETQATTKQDDVVVALATKPPDIPVVINHEQERAFDDRALMEARRQSPILIFSKANMPSGEGPIPLAKTSGSDFPFGQPVSGNNDGASSAGSAPTPRGFNPTSVGPAYASALGDRDQVIGQGKLIDAVLETSIDSDHPGLLRALVSHDIYGDSGRTVLLARGSRLIGQYDSAVAKGQNRVFVLWQRVISPDGINVDLASAGTDPLGGTGIEGHVNYHFWTMFGAATLLSVIGGATSTVGVNPSDQNNSLAQYRENISNGFSSAGETVLGQFAQIKPTIRVKQGTAVKVFVAKDLYFDSRLGAGGGAVFIP